MRECEIAWKCCENGLFVENKKMKRKYCVVSGRDRLVEVWTEV